MESTDDAHSVAAATTGARDFDEIADGDDQAQDSKRRRMEDDDAEDLEQAERSVQRLHVSARDPLVSVYKEHDSTVLVTIDSHSSVETDLSKVTHDIILALDNSGSMAIDKKIQMLNKLTMDILRLGLPGVDKANTRIGIVAFGTTAQVVLDLTCLGDVEGRTHTPYFEQLKADGGGTNIQGALELATVEHSNTKDSHNLRKHVVLITDGAPSHGHRDGRALRKHLLAPMKDPKNQQVFYHIIGLGPDVSKQFCDKFCDEGRAALFSFAEETSNLSNVFEEVCALMRFIAGPLILEFNDADPEAPWRARAGMHMHNGKVWQKEYIMNHHNLLIDRTVGPSSATAGRWRRSRRGGRRPTCRRKSTTSPSSRCPVTSSVPDLPCTFAASRRRTRSTRRTRTTLPTSTTGLRSSSLAGRRPARSTHRSRGFSLHHSIISHNATKLMPRELRGASFPGVRRVECRSGRSNSLS